MWHSSRPNKSVSFLISLALLTPAYCFSLSVSPCNAESADTHVEQGIYKQLEELVKKYYPKAKITTNGDSLHFEYKTKSESGFYVTDKEVVAPQEGGLIGDVSVLTGQYAADKKLGVEANGFHSTLILAPYSTATKAHMLATLLFPEDMSEQFQTGFKKIVGSYADAPESQIVPEANAQSASSTASATAATSSSRAAQTKKTSWAAILDAGSQTAVGSSLPIVLSELAPYRYLPGYPGSVKITEAKQQTARAQSGATKHIVELAFCTSDSVDAVCKTWSKRLQNDNWTIAVGTKPGIIQGYVNYKVTGDAHDADVTIRVAGTMTGSDVRIRYTEPAQ